MKLNHTIVCKNIAFIPAFNCVNKELVTTMRLEHVSMLELNSEAVCSWNSTVRQSVAGTQQ